MTITAAADGSALGNPGPAGWAWYISEDCWRAGGWDHGTNNMGELKAVLDLLEATAVASDQHLHILCDSQYVINSVTKWMPGWKRKGWRKKDGKPVLNVELLQAIDAALVGRSVEFAWVRGHAGHDMNEAADQRARAAATAFSKGRDPEIGPGFRAAASAASGASGTAAAADAEREPAAAVSRPEEAPADLLSLLAERNEDDPETAPGVCAPDLDASARALTDLAAADGSALEEVSARELVLLRDEVREDPPAAAELLHPAFSEVGASGREFDREAVLAELAPLEGTRASDLVAEEIAEGVVLLRYATTEPRGIVLRSSLWVREGGRWLLRHHQGTPARS